MQPRPEPRGSSNASRPSCRIRQTRSSWTRCRSPSTAAADRSAVPFPDETQPVEGEERVDELDRRRVRGDQVRKTTGGDRARVDRELVANAPDDAVHLAGEPVDESRLEARDGRLADDVLRLDEVDFAQTGCPGEQRVHGDLDPRCQNTAYVLGLW